MPFRIFGPPCIYTFVILLDGMMTLMMLLMKIMMKMTRRMVMIVMVTAMMMIINAFQNADSKRGAFMLNF